MAAAVADYRPAEPLEGKRPKSAEGWTVELEPTVDMLRAARRAKRNGQVLVGFGAEVGETGLERKRRMLADKNLDLVVYNDVSVPGIGFDAADNEVMLVSARASAACRRRPRREIAAGIVDEVERLIEERRGSE